MTDHDGKRIFRKVSAIGIAPTVVLALALSCAPKPRPEMSPTPPSDESVIAPEVMADTAAALPFEWITPEGWRAETIPFPLDFAPALPYSGVEELRFAPGMFKAGSEDFWTYAFVWWLAGDVRFDERILNSDLETYYEGLSLAVEEQGFDPQKAAAVARLAPMGRGSEMESRWVGTLSTHDPFSTHARVELHLEAQVSRSEPLDRTAVTFLVSPQPSSHAVWMQLARLRDAFHEVLNAAK